MKLKRLIGYLQRLVTYRTLGNLFGTIKMQQMHCKMYQEEIKQLEEENTQLKEENQRLKNG